MVVRNVKKKKKKKKELSSCRSRSFNSDESVPLSTQIKLCN